MVGQLRFCVSVLFNEPKLLKLPGLCNRRSLRRCFSALQRAEIAEMVNEDGNAPIPPRVSVLFNEPKLLKCVGGTAMSLVCLVSVLFNEPKLLKSTFRRFLREITRSFSALQRAEIAEMLNDDDMMFLDARFSALQRAEIAEIVTPSATMPESPYSFSALQRAEIAEMLPTCVRCMADASVSVLFNEPKLLKFPLLICRASCVLPFQCSSTSRNC